ncbi:MAG: UDP-N-acetylmuramate dehydrogenase [Minisyncoccia bacterium]
MALKILKNVSLSKFTTFRIGGKAKYLIKTKNKKEILEALSFAKEKNLPFFILGGGSNLLVSDEGFDGVIIKFENSGIKIKEKRKNEIFILIESGTKISKIISFSLKENLSGFEWAISIPGTLGGAIWGNISAFGSSIQDIVEEVEVLDSKTGKIKIFKNKDCKFSKKDSIFKHNKSLIILSAILKLKKEQKEKIKDKIKTYLDYRSKTQPLNFPSAGCIFLNPKFEIKNKNLFEKFPELKNFKKTGYIPAGYLIEKCNLKEEKIGGAEISKLHGNFILNKHKAKAKDVILLIKKIKKRVKDIFKINLKEEVYLLTKKFKMK